MLEVAASASTSTRILGRKIPTIALSLIEDSLVGPTLRNTLRLKRLKSGIWYQFINHRWIENDSGTSLRRCIGKNSKFV